MEPLTRHIDLNINDIKNYIGEGKPICELIAGRIEKILFSADAPDFDCLILDYLFKEALAQIKEEVEGMTPVEPKVYRGGDTE